MYIHLNVYVYTYWLHCVCIELLPINVWMGYNSIMFHVKHCEYMDCSYIAVWWHDMQYNNISVSRETMMAWWMDDGRHHIWMIVYDSWWMVDRLKDWNVFKTFVSIPIGVYEKYWYDRLLSDCKIRKFVHSCPPYCLK